MRLPPPEVPRPPPGPSRARGARSSAVDGETKQKVAIKKIPRAFDDVVDAKRISGQQKGDSTSLQSECSARARFGNSTHASRALRE